jgi:[NiFe] hydrogenase assembly HybE family chaperone
MSAHSDELRVSALAVRFREIGEQQMRGLPLFNPALEVEARDFLPYDPQSLIGVLITPWFMNLLLLPRDPEPIDSRAFGSSRVVALPGGERVFRYGGDEVIGVLWSYPLHSPMQRFASQLQARSEARLRLAQLMTAPEPVSAPENPGRRAFLGGR